MNGTASAFQSVSESSIDTVTGEQRVELKGARAAAAAWAALTPEQQEAKRKALRKRVEAEAAEISARFSVLPAVEDMMRLYDVAAQIAVMEQWWVATDRRRDSHMLIIGDLLDEAYEIFAEQDPEWDFDMACPEVEDMDEEAFFDEWSRLQDEAVRGLVLFARRYIDLTWGLEPQSYFEMDALRAYDVARQAIAAVAGVQCSCHTAVTEESDA